VFHLLTNIVTAEKVIQKGKVTKKRRRKYKKEEEE